MVFLSVCAVFVDSMYHDSGMGVRELTLGDVNVGADRDCVRVVENVLFGD